MASKRKLWSTLRSSGVGLATSGATREQHKSKVAAYRSIQRDAELWRDGQLRSPLVTVYVDERDGMGRTVYERIDLREVVASWQVQ